MTQPRWLGPMTSEEFTLSVPRTEWNGRGADMRTRLVTWKWRFDLGSAHSGMLLDFTRVEFMEPWAMAMFGAYGLEMRRRGIIVHSKFDASPSNLYLVEMGSRSCWNAARLRVPSGGRDPVRTQACIW
jgi:hypothetical protein